MAEYYPRAPIIEAVIELQFEAVPHSTVEKAHQRLRSRYERSEEVLQFEVRAQVGVPMVPGVNQTPIGFKLTSGDETDVINLRLNSLGVSREAPYPGWDHLFGRLQEDWKAWRKVCPRPTIKRLGVRFINRIDVPLHGLKTYRMGEYVTLTAQAPSPRPFIQEGLDLTVVQRLQGETMGARVNMATAEPVLIDHAAILLDVDVFRDVDVPQRDEDIWTMLHQMRVLKNEYFEGSITEAARELFR